MNKLISLILISFLAFFFSCTNNSFKAPVKKRAHTARNYMRTGFYYLATADGIRMRQEGTHKIYLLSRTPFASVDNISRTELKKTKLKDVVYTDLCIKFDEKGTRDLEEGSGNIAHPKIAVVLANKLFYVVDNTSKMKTGAACISLIGYSDQEMAAIKEDVDQKN